MGTTSKERKPMVVDLFWGDDMSMKNTNNALEELVKLQKDIIIHIIRNPSLIKKFHPPQEKVNEETINFMLLNNDNYNIVFQIYKAIISKIIYSSFFEKDKVKLSQLSQYFYCFKKEVADALQLDIDISRIIAGLTNEDILELLERFHQSYLKSRFLYKEMTLKKEKSKINFRDKGSVYTENKITKEITRNTIDNAMKCGVGKKDLKILDFGCGTGRFYLAAFRYLTLDLKMNKKEVVKNNLYGIDLDSLAIDILRITIYVLMGSKKLSDLEFISKNITNKNMLISESVPKGDFNVVISNPPYFLLKVNQKAKQDKNTKYFYDNLTKKIKNELEFFRNSGVYNYSIEGMLNYYKLSIEMMLQISSHNAEIGIICPSTLFTDLSSRKLRKHLLTNSKVREINYYPESAKLFDDVTQATVIFYVQKGTYTDKIKVKSNGDSFEVDFNLIEKVFSKNYEVPYISKIGWGILKKLAEFKKIKDLQEVKNKRGELDLTLYKKCITHKNTGYRLVRGNMISEDSLSDKNGEYVLIGDFLKCKSNEFRNNGFNRKRLACQQISNVSIPKRLKFVLIGKKDILANSCNYIYSENEKELLLLKGLLNSFLLNWRFKIVSGNNHINNYELDELPIIDLNGINLENKDKLTKNIIINESYGLSKEESKYILNNFFEDQELVKLG